MFRVVLCAASSSFLNVMRNIYVLVLPPVATRDFGVRGLQLPNQLAFSQLLKKVFLSWVCFGSYRWGMNQIPQINAFSKAITRNEKQIKRSRNKLLSIHQKSTIRIVKAR